MNSNANTKSPLGLRAAVLTACVAASAAALAANGDNETKATFKDPVRLSGAGTPIETEAPGYAAPAWYDVNGDGRSDLVVGQFAGGKMKAFHQAEDGSLGKGEWIMAGEKVAEVPGVW